MHSRSWIPPTAGRMDAKTSADGLSRRGAPFGTAVPLTCGRAADPRVSRCYSPKTARKEISRTSSREMIADRSMRSNSGTIHF